MTSNHDFDQLVAAAAAFTIEGWDWRALDGRYVETPPPDDKARLALPNAHFDLVLNRHESFDPADVRRILRPGGRFLTQQGRRAGQRGAQRCAPGYGDAQLPRLARGHGGGPAARRRKRTDAVPDEVGV